MTKYGTRVIFPLSIGLLLWHLLGRAQDNRFLMEVIMKTLKRLGRLSLIMFLCLTVIGLGQTVLGGGAEAQAKMVQQTATGHSAAFDQLAQSATGGAELEMLSAGGGMSIGVWVGLVVGVMSIVAITLIAGCG